MPSLQQPAPYDTVETVLEYIRVIMADYVQNATDLSGDFFADTQPYALPTVNLAWRMFQRKLAVTGNARLQPTIVIPGLPAVNSAVQADAATYVYLSWTGYFDGVNLLDTPILPPDLMFPITIGERLAGTPYRFTPMQAASDGIPSTPPGSWLRLWEWVGLPGGAEVLRMKGSLLSKDLEMRYAAFLPDIVADEQGLDHTYVPYMRCAEVLGYYSAAIYVSPREDGQGKAAEYEEKGDKALAELLSLPTKEILSRVTFRRRPGIGGRRWRLSR